MGRSTNQRQPFSRLPVPGTHAAIQPVISDIYDKLSTIPQNLANQVQSQFDALKTQIVNGTVTTSAVPGGASGGGGGSKVLDISGATGLAANPQYSYIPALLSLPDSTPGSSVYTQDGLVVEVTTAPYVSGQFYRYDATTMVWTLLTGGGGGSVIIDTNANRDINYPPVSTPTGSLYIDNDRQAIYYNSGLAWVLVAGLGFGPSASKYLDLGANDVGFTWYGTDNFTIYVWDGTVWAVVTQQSALAGSHGDRISYGNGTVAGSVLTATSGPAFMSYWVGSRIGIGGFLFTITIVTDATHLTVSGTPTAGGTSWYFSLFPAINYLQGTVYSETDRQTIYVVGTGSGVCNLSHFLVTWISGPYFSPYWIGQSIIINGIGYIVGSATLTSIGLLNDSGLISTGLSWVIGKSVWFYETGIYHAGTSSKPTDLNAYSDLGFMFHDTTVLVTYFGVKETAFSTLALYLAWFDGIESLTFSAWGARTFYASDAGYQVRISDYEHEIVWTGSTWRFAPGDASKYLVHSIDGNPPNGGVWHLCDGSSVNVFEVVGGVPQVNAFTLPDLTTAAIFRGGAYTGTIDPATSPTFTGGTVTTDPNTTDHTHSVAITSGNESATHNHSLSSTTVVLYTGAGSPTVAANPTPGTGTESATHTHSVSGTSGGESATHDHDVDLSSATIDPLTVGHGMPASIALQSYCRQ